ncbi:GFA family protein [Amphibiibacter pelophylacis]|uniref:GFA family protein n=1 Tax=Amphibiibacter pelophylacis TaxID=1799477 RepID=A0ACC6P1J9_9BURK
MNFKLGAEPLATRICWCRDCQHLAANGTVNVMVAAEALSVSGPLSDYTQKADSGNDITRQFCPTGGTHLFARSSARPQFRVVRTGNLDNPASIQPTAIICSASAPAWACLDPALKRVEQQPAAPKPPAAVRQAERLTNSKMLLQGDRNA